MCHTISLLPDKLLQIELHHCIELVTNPSPCSLHDILRQKDLQLDTPSKGQVYHMQFPIHEYPAQRHTVCTNAVFILTFTGSPEVVWAVDIATEGDSFKWALF